LDLQNWTCKIGLAKLDLQNWTRKIGLACVRVMQAIVSKFRGGVDECDLWLRSLAQQKRLDDSLRYDSIIGQKRFRDDPSCDGGSATRNVLEKRTKIIQKLHTFETLRKIFTRKKSFKY
jgi:hypothetical protein